MLSLRRIALFCLLVLVYYGALVIPLAFWPAAREAYRAGYIAVAQSFFGDWSYNAQARFTALPEGERSREHDIQIALGKRDVENVALVRFSSIRWGYLSTALTVALILATPLPLKRRLWGLVWGLILVNVFVVGRLFILLLYYFSDTPDIQLYEPGPFWGRLLFEAHEQLFRVPTASFLVPVLIWAVVALLRMPRSDVPAEASRAASARRS